MVVQRSTSSIGDILPLLCTTIISLERFILTENAAEFRDTLVTKIKMKFYEELNSTIYLTAVFLCKSKLAIWLKRLFAVKLMEKSEDAFCAAAKILYSQAKRANKQALNITNGSNDALVIELNCFKKKNWVFNRKCFIKKFNLFSFLVT